MTNIAPNVFICENVAQIILTVIQINIISDYYEVVCVRAFKNNIPVIPDKLMTTLYIDYKVRNSQIEVKSVKSIQCEWLALTQHGWMHSPVKTQIVARTRM